MLSPSAWWMEKPSCASMKGHNQNEQITFLKTASRWYCWPLTENHTPRTPCLFQTEMRSLFVPVIFFQWTDFQPERHQKCIRRNGISCVAWRNDAVKTVSLFFIRDIIHISSHQSLNYLHPHKLGWIELLFGSMCCTDSHCLMHLAQFYVCCVGYLGLLTYAVGKLQTEPLDELRHPFHLDTVINEYVAKHKAVVIRNYAKDWPAMNWTRSVLKEKCGHRSVFLECGENTNVHMVLQLQQGITGAMSVR